jgi:hypothetical protein
MRPHASLFLSLFVALLAAVSCRRLSKWLDAVPESGSDTLTRPSGKDVSVSFLRESALSIAVTISGPMVSHTFHVLSFASP